MTFTNFSSIITHYDYNDDDDYYSILTAQMGYFACVSENIVVIAPSEVAQVTCAQHLITCTCYLIVEILLFAWSGCIYKV